MAPDATAQIGCVVDWWDLKTEQLAAAFVALRYGMPVSWPTSRYWLDRGAAQAGSDAAARAKQQRDGA
jgi:hypothetical protein